MTERRFTRSLHRPGMAAQLRENVSEAVRATTTQSRPHFVDAIDFEEFISKNKVMLNNDPLRELLIYPNDDLSLSVTARECRTLQCLSSLLLQQEVTDPLVRQCLATYSQDLSCLTYKYSPYSGSYLQLPRLPRVDDLREQIYEIDTDMDQGDLVMSTNGENVMKKGYLLKGPESGSEKIFGNFSSRTFKRRFAVLRQEVDGTYLLEFHKDERKQDAKGTIVMDFCTQISKNLRRGKCCFELQMTEGSKTILLSAESETDLEDWIDKLTRVIHADKACDDLRSNKSSGESVQIGTKFDYQTLNPRLNKFVKEDFIHCSISRSRDEGRCQLFSCYPTLPRTVDVMIEADDEAQIWPNKEKFGVRFRIICQSLRFRLQAPLDSEEGPLSQLEPYMSYASLYDVNRGCKISEDFHFDLNNPMIRNLITRNKGDEGQEMTLWNPLVMAGIPKEWIAYPKQAVMSVTEPHSDIYLVVHMEKVLQGGIVQSVEPYLKPTDPKTTLKLQKLIKLCCKRMGDFRMPFGWSARPVFKNSGDLDTESQFSPIYRSDEKKLSEAEMIKFLSDFRKPEKMNKLTVIPGLVNIKILPMEVTLPNSVTPSLELIIPFPNPPTHEPTLEVQEFCQPITEHLNPHVVFNNLLYVYPHSLNYENQKSFSRARNIVCWVELRDSDAEAASALKVIFGRPGLGPLTLQGSTVVLHHMAAPEWSDEVKMALPINLTSSHHLLFTFAHVAVDGAKTGKEVAIESVVGYAWLPLLSKGRFCSGDQMLPVACHLPLKYLTVEPLGLGKGFSGPDLRWVDNQKNLFRVSLRLESTILGNDQHFHNFFLSSSFLVPKLNSSSDSISVTSSVGSSQTVDLELLKNLKALLTLEIHTIISFLPTVFNQLFIVLLNGGCDVASNVTRVFVHVIENLYEANREDLIHSYVKHVMNPQSNNSRLTIHEELSRALCHLLQPSCMDLLMMTRILRHLHILFSFIHRSMALHLVTTTRIKMIRNERFTEQFQTELKSLVQLVSSLIVQQLKDNPEEVAAANTALAHFLKRCLSLMDRGFVFGLVKDYLEHFSPGDPISLQSFKFVFLRIICSHEHFIPLNLPMFNTPTVAESQKSKLRFGCSDFFLSADFLSHHFLVGVVLSELRCALNELGEVQRIAICVLRDLLAKHSFDDRYVQTAQQGRIACLYFPFITILLENVKRLSFPSEKGVYVKKRKEKSSSHLQTPRASEADINALQYRKGSTLSSLSSRMADSSFLSSRGGGDSSYLSMIAGPGGLNVPAPPVTPARSCSSLEEEDLTSIANSDLPEDSDFDRDEDEKSHMRNLSVAFAGETGPVRYDKLGAAEVRDLLLCFLHVIKNVPEGHLVTWWGTLSQDAFSEFFYLLQLSLHHFKYNGKRRIVAEQQIQAHKRVNIVAIKHPLLKVSHSLDTVSVNSHESEGWLRALQEANLASEVGLIVLDVVGLFLNYCGEDGDDVALTWHEPTILIRQVFSIHLLFLQLGQSENLLKHVLASLRSFINKFPHIIFQGDASLCGSVCFEMLKCCNSKLTSVRHESCLMLYLLMRSNYEFTQQAGINRVHLQVIISVSQLLGEIIGLNNCRFQESLALINTFAASDAAISNTGFVSEVRDLTKRIRTVLVATAQMREHERDPEMLCDLQHSLAASYAATPELRTTWLQAMAKHHVKHGHLSEAAFCQLHICALMAEHLRHQGLFCDGCLAFSIISENIPRDEGNLRIDTDFACASETHQLFTGLVDSVFTMDSLVYQLETANAMIERAERYELLGNMYRILIPIYESRRDYAALVQCYWHLYQAYTKVVEVNTSQKRLLGRYYRVAFYGPNFFEDEAGQEYIYKEPKVTSLAEISERLYHQYCNKFGKEVVKMIMDSNRVNADELDSRYAFIQVTHVIPFFTEEQLPERQTEFERNNNINSFMFETPFTKEGRAHGKLQDQYKRRVVLTTDYTFPYVKKRILVIDKQEREMKPIEVAIDEMESRVKELCEIIHKKPTDLKKLQLKLQGSISVQVNAGPLAYASTFLCENNSRDNAVNEVCRLKEVYRQFIHLCKQALDLNGSLISSDQFEYQMALETNFSELVASLTTILNEPILTSAHLDTRESEVKRSSQHYLSIISSPAATSDSSVA